MPRGVILSLIATSMNIYCLIQLISNYFDDKTAQKPKYILSFFGVSFLF